jgi:hypothetical protein
VSGYVNDEVFDPYCVDHLIRECERKRKTFFEEEPDERIRALKRAALWFLLCLDGFGSHVNLVKALIKLWKYKIMVLKMPSHCSHNLQVLDTHVFRETKRFFREWLRFIAFDAGQLGVPSYQLASIITKALVAGQNKTSIVKGFSDCGLFPFDPEWPAKHESLFEMSENFKKPSIVLSNPRSTDPEKAAAINKNMAQFESWVSRSKVRTKEDEGSQRLSLDTDGLDLAISLAAEHDLIDPNLTVADILYKPCLAFKNRKNTKAKREHDKYHRSFSKAAILNTPEQTSMMEAIDEQSRQDHVEREKAMKVAKEAAEANKKAAEAKKTERERQAEQETPLLKMLQDDGLDLGKKAPTIYWDKCVDQSKCSRP